jgi:hypothetical protein
MQYLVIVIYDNFHTLLLESLLASLVARNQFSSKLTPYFNVEIKKKYSINVTNINTQNYICY